MTVRSWILENFLCEQTKLVHLLASEYNNYDNPMYSNLPFCYSQKTSTLLSNSELQEHKINLSKVKEGIIQLETEAQNLLSQSSSNFTASRISEVQQNLQIVFDQIRQLQEQLDELNSFQNYGVEKCTWYLFDSDAIPTVFDKLGFPIFSYGETRWVGFTIDISNCFDEHRYPLSDLLAVQLRDGLDDKTIATGILEFIANLTPSSQQSERIRIPKLILNKNHYYRRMPFTTNNS